MLVGSIGAAVAYQSGAPPRWSRASTTPTSCSRASGGYLFFGEAPDTLTATGMAMILVGGVIAVTRGRA